MIDQINKEIFGEHPSSRLKEAYKGFQGCIPAKADIIILGKDPFYPIDIEQSPIFDELITFLETGVDFYIDKPGIQYFYHHPYLSKSYGKGVLWRYHNNFRRIFGKCPDGKFLSNKDYDDYLNWSRKTTMIELIGTPTYGMSKVNSDYAHKQAKTQWQNMLYSAQNAEHLKLIRNILFNSASKTIFVAREVYSLLRNIFPILKKEFPNDSYTIDNLYTNASNTNLKSLRHPSASIREEYFEQLKIVMMKACVRS
jgi:hypothetical protein